IELAHVARRVVKRGACVQEQAHGRVRLFFGLFDVEPVRARIDAPVNAAHLIARDVWAMLRKLLRESVIRTPVQADEEAFDDRARDKVEPPDGGQHYWLKQAFVRRWNGHLKFVSTCHWP